MPSSDSSTVRVLHFVAGGSGSSLQIAAELARDQLEAGAVQQRFEPLLVLRRKPSTDLDRVARLQAAGLRVELIPGGNDWLSAWALFRLCRRFRPQLLVAHGFPEHLLGRWVALLAGVPRRIAVEHYARERYSRWQRLQARWLARRSDAVVGVSSGVEQGLLRQGLPSERTHCIPSGIDLSRFTAVPAYTMREPGIVMSGRFSRQKDHLSLIRALALLRDEHGLRPELLLAGSGKAHYQREAEGLAERLKLSGQVRFLGYEPQVGELLKRRQIFVLSTRWEGMPLTLVEAMAAGCACVASLVPGVVGVLEHERTGLLVPPQDPPALAAALKQLLNDPLHAERLADAAREQALSQHGLPLMCRRYEELFTAVCKPV